MNKFILKFLWLEKSVAVALDQKVCDKTIPLTEYFFWPQKDAWEDMKFFLDNKSWISQVDSIKLLNEITEVINFWQDKEDLHKKEIYKVRERFPNCLFVGFD
jgi:30S ribosomal protein 3